MQALYCLTLKGLAAKHGVPMLMHGQVAQIYEALAARRGEELGNVRHVVAPLPTAQTH